MRNGNVINFNINDLLAKLKGNTLVLGIVIFFIFMTLVKSIIIVGAGERVVVFNSFVGVEKRTLGEGMHFLVPYVQSPINYDVKAHSYTMSGRTDEGEQRGDDAIECLTADGQKIKLDVSVIYSLMPDKVWLLHQQVGKDYIEKILRPTVRTIARNTVSNYSVIELYTGKRQLVQTEIQEKVTTELEKYFIHANEVLLRNITFSEEFSKAIEQKQVALQDAERMKYVLQKEKMEKDRKIIEAEGDAAAITKKGAALKANPQLIQYEYVTKLTPGIKTIITNQSSIMNFPADMLKD